MKVHPNYQLHIHSLIPYLSSTATWATWWRPFEEVEQQEYGHLPYLQGWPLDHQVPLQGHTRTLCYQGNGGVRRSAYSPAMTVLPVKLQAPVLNTRL